MYEINPTVHKSITARHFPRDNTRVEADFSIWRDYVPSKRHYRVHHVWCLDPENTKDFFERVWDYQAKNTTFRPWHGYLLGMLVRLQACSCPHGRGTRKVQATKTAATLIQVPLHMMKNEHCPLVTIVNQINLFSGQLEAQVEHTEQLQARIVTMAIIAISTMAIIAITNFKLLVNLTAKSESSWQFRGPGPA